ncbi:zinc-binding dehydrogenase [Azospirillum sp.]|uniref:zinc-binding dehydrogenase n=1 Tax=Azospirillum sp. TaxID=34012 RepID=UPI002D4F71A0|nr:alcohol dehydrogenase catalytic domain-containing protein [Azospirillum sp.]HYF89534.1 alcohol dehydrogenase catalytic domain-containing protein [Azospirillum sp.]
MTATYRAMAVTAPGRLELVEKPIPVPAAGEVLIAVEACGICGADRGDVEKADPALGRVPGHEVVGRITVLGLQVPSIWTVSQRVGISRFGGHCGDCRECRRGKFHLCRQQPVMGASRDGGYAEMMTARATGLVSIPDDLSSQEAAPILCAGLATFNGLKAAGAGPGDTVAVLGIGGLGHMAVQYARRMGFRVIAIGRGQDIAADALTLGAHRYVDTEREDAAAVLTGLGGAAALLSTVGDMGVVAAVMPGLAPEGRLVLLGIGKDPLAVSTGHLVGGERSIVGSITGSPWDNERTLDFSVLTGARPWIETLPLARADEAFRRMLSGDVKFRMVLTMGDSAVAPQ